MMGVVGRLSTQWCLVLLVHGHRWGNKALLQVVYTDMYIGEM